MKTTEMKAIPVLIDLIETCEVGQQGFGAAARNTRENALRTLFLDYSSECERFAAELRSEFNRIVGCSAGEGSKVREHGWPNLLHVLSTNQDEAIVAECEASEDIALKRYRAALGTSLPAEVQATITRQLSEIETDHSVLNSLKSGCITAGAGNNSR